MIDFIENVFLSWVSTHQYKSGYSETNQSKAHEHVQPNVMVCSHGAGYNQSCSCGDNCLSIYRISILYGGHRVR